eukprot:CAMPEP_0118700108 /NCGR_PEP_ID=MMETSP0800-20121206/16360_1 /TAXON_ID=210618 ORGANISM="Striatella unipunctata, Strain CCMP2910" /NCGR_SAMPLE_ID=MMETSP0800 /ASSEMBLY_ACC=CAM_ASM_000638 /LENGTH=79 /DNA_ID=CAMNT_0006600577 /DNA_START=70 /DNA_END=305 /DNA_ORIENTATION=+
MEEDDDAQETSLEGKKEERKSDDEANAARSGRKATGKRELNGLRRSLTSDIFNAARIKRERRQPTLYDPQTCPASEWQS